MRTALIISGQPRSVETTFPFIKQNIIDINHPDVYIHMWFDENDIGKQFVSAGGVVASNPLPENIRETVYQLYDPQVVMMEPNIEFDELDYNERKYPQIKPRNSLSQRYSIKKSFQLMKDSGIEYDAVIRIRFDWAIQTPINVEELPLTKVTVPNDCPHAGGFNDQFAVSNVSNMEIYASLFDAIPTLYKYGVPFCDEILLGEHLLQNKLEINPIHIQYHLQRATV